MFLVLLVFVFIIFGGECDGRMIRRRILCNGPRKRALLKILRKKVLTFGHPDRKKVLKVALRRDDLLSEAAPARRRAVAENDHVAGLGDADVGTSIVEERSAPRGDRAAASSGLSPMRRCNSCFGVGILAAASLPSSRTQRRREQIRLRRGCVDHFREKNAKPALKRVL